MTQNNLYQLGDFAGLVGQTDIVSLDRVGLNYPLVKRHASRVTSIVNLIKRSEANHDVFWAVRDVSFQVGPGEVFGIIGPNGSGKSTLLKVIAGIYPPDAGVVYVKASTSLLSLGTAFHGDLTLKDNLFLTGALMGFKHGQIDEIKKEILDFAELALKEQHPLKTLSAGQKTRLGFALSIMAPVEVLLVDEYLVVGDEHFRQKCEFKINQLRSKKTILLVSHDLDMILKFCNRCLWLDNGHLMEIGNPEMVVRSYRKHVEGYQ